MDESGRPLTLAEKWEWEASLEPSLRRVRSQCQSCRHYREASITCPAFPTGIPVSIILNRYDHRRPYPIQASPELWEAKDEEATHPKAG